MAPLSADVAFLVDVDNTLLDNGAVVADLRRHLRDTVGAEGEQRYWNIFEELFLDPGFADYLGALRAMSRQSNPDPLLRMADRAQRWASLVDWSTMPRAVVQLEQCNALVAPDEAEEQGLTLLDPVS